MPDLRSELEKVIHAWETPAQPETTNQPTPIMNTSTTQANLTHNEFLFNFVRDNPGLKAKQIETLVGDRVPSASLSSLLAQMAKRHLLAKSAGDNGMGRNGTFTAVADKYMSPAEQLGVGRGHRMSKGKKKITRTKKQVAPVQQQDLFTPPHISPIMPVAPVSMRDFDVESLTIGEARALRDKLNALFSA